MSTAELLAGMVSTGGCEPSRAAASCGSVWTPPRLHVSPASWLTLPPSSIAAGLRPQLDGSWTVPLPVLNGVVLPPTIDPWKRALVATE